ncbi:uncharacterized protein Z518_01698 [Rhinocladiella mackenziei CBS 650.93]|uniref:Uncharacterized protein n=1 Tax=Rhinocladiella mackenziei CBS 650.93 TaxID=1442369 RepID=A0A0D2IX77_9EURO|nr:uncharacterized protein Z518_01698 [Rhinocladiella mackenziei CBS 650.93]KIX10614.1 hypothetical protein Z518_01698 [Rhinocladiella mackenziei CBS 650.93]
MDGNDRRRSQYGQPYQTQAQSRPLPGQPVGPASGERYPQPATPARSDIGRSSMTRPYLPGFPGYGYQEPQYGSSQMPGGSPLQGVEMQYPPTYMQGTSRQQQVQASPPQHQQQYAQYAQGSMLPPVGPPSIYDNVPFQQRQTAIEVMANQFAMPQYMGHGEHAGVGVGSSSSQYVTSQPEQGSYGSVAVSRPSLPASYSTGQVDFSVMEQREAEELIPPSGSQEALNEGLREYQQQLKSTFDAIITGRVTDASEKILVVSRWLVSSVTALGLHHDDETRQAERIGLWREFNLCWEALGQKQKDITEEALRTRRQPADVLSADTIKSLVDELVSLCDQLEQYGLVDFEMGIWEEQIVHIFTVCLDLLPQDETTTQTGRAGAETS